MVRAAISDPTTAPVSERVRSVLMFLNSWVPPEGEPTTEHIQAMREAGVSDPAIREALKVSFCFQAISRFADTFAWKHPTPRSQTIQAFLLWHLGYGRASIPPDRRWPGPMRALPQG